MFYTYLLKSKINNDLYIGSCEDLKVRFNLHNLGRVKSTKAYKPWILIYYEAYRDKRDATKRERELKMHKSKAILLERISNSMKIV